MFKRILFYLFLTTTFLSKSQEIYVVNNVNDIQVVTIEDLSVTYLFTVPIAEAGFITDLAFAPNGNLYGVTNVWTIIEIDLINKTFTTIADLPSGDSYTALVSNADFELFTSKYLSQELYKYNILTQETTFVSNEISTPGDFTFYKGNLVYPGFFNDFIKSFDGTNITDVGCSVPLLWTFVNHFEDCETNTIYAFDQFAKLYQYDLETENYELLADLVSETGILYGGATTSEYLASTCPLQKLETVDCVLGNNYNNPHEITLKANPVTHFIELSLKTYTELKFEIYSVNGKRLASGGVRNNQILIENLASGFYFLKIYTNDGTLVFQKKIIKK